MEPRILVVTAARNVQRHVTRSLASVGYRPEHISWDGAVSERLREGLDMCIVDADVEGDRVRWLLETLSADHGQVIPLIISRDGRNPVLRDLLGSHNLNNLIAKHGGVSASSEMIDETELIVTCEKLFRGDIFGIDKYLSIWAAKIHEHSVASTDDKLSVVEELKGFLEAIDCFGAIKPLVAMAANELLMNAMYNAPRDAEGNGKYVERDRRERLHLDPGEEVQFQYACDGRNIALSVKDNFGSLDRKVIVKYLERCFSGEKGVPEEKKAGAGLGLYMVFSSITQLTFNIHEGQATEVIALFFARKGAKGLHTSGRSLNIFFMQ